MNKEFKKTFFTCLMVVLLVISNLIGMKLTNFMDVTIGVDFVTYPFTFLCTLLIMNLGSKKDAYRSILVASIIQLLITISYTIAVSLGTQSLMPDSAMYVNHLFKVNQLNILASILAFVTSHCLLIYIYENFKHFNKELYGLVIGLLGSMFLNSIIFLVITLNEYEPIFVINMLLSNVIVDIIMIVIITILFYILKEKDIVTYNKTDNINNKDLGLEEVIIKEEKKDVKKTKKTNSNVKTVKKSNTNRKNNTSKKSNSSKKIVKKENK